MELNWFRFVEIAGCTLLGYLCGVNGAWLPMAAAAILYGASFALVDIGPRDMEQSRDR